MDEYLSPREAAEILGVSDRTVRNLCEQRKLKHRRLSARNIQIKREWLEDYQSSIIIEPVNGENSTNGGKENDEQ